MSIDHFQNSSKGAIAYLNGHPSEARSTGPDGASIATDIPETIGGGGTAPSPGWLSWAALSRGLDILFVWSQRWQQRRDLLALSDSISKDIGVSRADIEAEASKPFWRE